MQISVRAPARSMLAALFALSFIGFAPHAKAQDAPAAESGKSRIVQRLRGLRSLNDADRARETRSLARDIRGIRDAADRLHLSEALANLVTEGDPGRSTLQEVAATLADALRTDPDAKGDDGGYTTLAQLIRYENVRVRFDSPQLAAAMAKLENEDRQRQDADFSLKDLQGTTWSLASLRGKVVLVNFWATWCPPCRKELPDLEALYQRLQSRGFVVLGISDEEIAKVQPFVAEHGISYPILLDPGSKVHTDFAIEGIPRTLVYDRSGRLAAEAIDMRTQKQLLALIARAGLSD